MTDRYDAEIPKDELDEARAKRDIAAAGECAVHCSVCEGEAHHWMPDGIGFGDEEDDPDEPVSDERSVWVGCKHCDVRVYGNAAYDILCGDEL